MADNGYSKDYLHRLNAEINRILSAANSKNWQSYADIYTEYVEAPLSPTRLRRKRCLLGIIEHFDVRGQYPNGRRRHKIVEHSKYHQLNQEFRSAIDWYRASAKEHGIKDSTIYGVSCTAASFLLDIQRKGIDTFNEITEKDVLSAFMIQDGDFIRSYACKDDIAAVFNACIPKDAETFTRILAFLPTLRKNRKNIQYLQAEEITQLKQILADNESRLSKRDRAIGILALYTGLRRSDIAGMTMNAIDWMNDRICLIQQKTSVPLELPLTATVGNAVYDYMMNERPETQCEYIFVSFHRPHERLNNGSLYAISDNIMKASNIRRSVGDRKGFHIFRHHLATELLGKGVPSPVISNVLGQTSPKSLESYLSADFKHLKECAISIENFQILKGVLDNA